MLFILTIPVLVLTLIFGPKWQRQYVAAVAGAIGVVLVFGLILALLGLTARHAVLRLSTGVESSVCAPPQPPLVSSPRRGVDAARQRAPQPATSSSRGHATAAGDGS